MAQQALKDYFDVQLQTAAGEPLPTIEYDGTRFFVCEAGQSFVVSVSMINYTRKTYRVSLRVDGEQPGYTLIYHGHHSTYRSTFQGWLQQSGTVTGPCSTTYRLFKLGSCKPGQSAATVQSADEIPAGKIEVLLDEVYDTGRQQQSLQVRAAAPPGNAAGKKLPEGKKWFLAPGLQAEAGAVQASATSWSTAVYETVRSLPSITVRYDSSESLFLRKALNPRFAPHRAILRKSTNPAIRALGAEPVGNGAALDEATSRPNTAAAAAAAAGGAGVKREGAGLKREHDGNCDYDDDEPAVPRSATAAERVDLTEEAVRPMMVGGRQVAADEFAVCDLCDSDDEQQAAPKWEVKKKQHIDVEL